MYSGHQFFSGHYYLFYYQNNNFGYPRLGVVAGKKSLKKATTRSCVRRIVKENFRILKYCLPPLDIVFIAKAQSKKASKKVLHACVSQLFRRLITCKIRKTYAEI
ncbi:ribonuclease P protein component [Coxiella endosymbiont of Amblyomma americanum]|nr:ribonuclease P protein component [Coxiella endosymbiont of Amblyomma americanum]